MIHQRELTGGPAARRSTWLAVEAVSDGAAFAALREEWSGLLERSHAGTFNAWEWLYPWWRRIASDRDPWILTARDREGALIGLLPLGLERRRVLGKTIRRLAFLGETHIGSDYLDVIALPGAEREVTAAFAAELAERRADWDVLDLLDLDERSPTLEALVDGLHDRIDEDLTVEQAERYICPYQRLDRFDDFEAFLSQTSRASNYRRRKRWLERQEGYAIERVEDPGALARPMAEFFRLHDARWAGDGGSQGIKGPSVEAFHRDATELLAERRKLWMYTLKLGDEALASVYGIVDRGRFSYFQSGYDPAWRNKSVGLVLVGKTFEDAFAAGLREYDFLRGTESYKSDWVSEQRRTVSLRVHPKSGVGALLGRHDRAAKAARDLVKKALPEKAVERVRRYRRRLAAV